MAAEDSPPETETDTETITESSLDDAVRLRAYQISQSDEAGTPEENWERAERELGPAAE
jgi:hypothetical protein